ncbi:MAG: hypothetical protein IKH50_02195, partial [Oscillospiraceae bacterium]|nr:hypothetical protein [Oscillospiraceae bacterium]
MTGNTGSGDGSGLSGIVTPVSGIGVGIGFNDGSDDGSGIGVGSGVGLSGTVTGGSGDGTGRGGGLCSGSVASVTIFSVAGASVMTCGSVTGSASVRTFSAEGDGDGGAAVFEGDSVCAASVTSLVIGSEVSEDFDVSGMDGPVKGAPTSGGSSNKHDNTILTSKDIFRDPENGDWTLT